VTLDGGWAAGHEPHPDGRNGGVAACGEDQQRSRREVFQAGEILLGRVTYEIFAAFWPSAPKDEGFADRMNDIPKYVVSRTLETASWRNSTVVGGDPVEAITELKREPGVDILLYGSGDLLNSLVGREVIDEYRIMVFPVLLGGGKRLFKEATDTTHLDLVDTRTFGSGVTVLTYRPADLAPSSTYVETFAWTGEHMRSWQAAQDAERVLATILFTDIVRSTERAAAIGDQRWRRLLDRHDEVARTEVDRFRGRLVKSTGDGILATFDAPTRALRCAFALTDARRRRPPDPLGDPHGRDRDPRRRRRRDRRPHRRSSPDPGAGSGGRRDPNGPGSGDGHRPRVRLARLGEPPRRPRRVGAVHGVGRVNPSPGAAIRIAGSARRHTRVDGTGPPHRHVGGREVDGR
jgi:dihydrofolate reductase